jgi:hypothetical protein
MIALTVPQRPFSTDRFTGLMLPDGFFEAALGRQRINAHVTNIGAGASPDAHVYLESVSNPAIVVTPHTYSVPSLVDGAAQVFTWDADFTDCPPGVHYVSFVAADAVNPADRRRTIKKIFVTSLRYDNTSGTFSLQAPEGTLEVRFHDMIGPEDPLCCKPLPGRSKPGDQVPRDFLGPLAGWLGELGELPEGDFCAPFYLAQTVELVLTPDAPYAGQYGDLPYQDPWWKTLLIILCIVAIIAAAVIAAVYGGPVVITGLSVTLTCCAAPVADAIFAGLIAIAGGTGVAAGAKDVRDPFRRGEDNTAPAAGELTTAESVKLTLSYPEPLALGKPFAVDAHWDYTRITTGANYDYSVTETNKNVHVLSKYEIQAPDVVRTYKEEPFVITGEFFGPDGVQLQGNQLFVQCFLEGLDDLHGQYRGL